MKRPCYIFFLIFLSISLHAQLQTAHWYFGNKAGLDFSSGNPVIDTNGKIVTNEGCTSISDEFGNLLFYSDGQKVYDRTHSIMQNGGGLLGHTSSTSSAIVLPKPDNCNLYYLFTIDARELRQNGINYNVIDMTANGGLGAVIEKNIPVPVNGIQQGYEKLAAISNADKTGYWIVTHFEGNFYAFPVTGDGVGMNPVVSPSTVFGGSQFIGYLKASPDGSKLGMGMFSSAGNQNAGYLSVYDFDPATGIVYNEIILYQPETTPGNYYGIEFSPNGKLLYATNIIISSTVATKIYIEQYNLTAPSIAGSKYLVSLNAHYGALQLALDGKIYNSGFEDEYIGAITNPDTAYNPGTGAHPAYNRKYVDLRPYLSLMTSKWGLPTFLNNYFRMAPLNINGLPISEDQQYCVENTLDFNYCYQGGQIQNIHWDFGDGSTSEDFYPTHTYANPGNYTITLTITVYGNTYVHNYPVTIIPKIKPTFAGLPSHYCQNAIPQTLPAVSDNGVTGTWNPSVIDTSTIGTKMYTFTPNDDCAETFVLTVEIKDKITPQFSLKTEYYQNQTPENLPIVSQNGISGTWNPAAIDTSTIGTKTYTFTPNDDCAETFVLTVEIKDKITPIFSLKTEYCQNQTPEILPNISQNGISGTWYPSVIDTSTIGMQTYTFTPDDDCAEPFTLTVEIKNKTTPQFTLRNEYCKDDTPETLPSTSDNGITGVWSPSSVDTSAIGTTSYTFTPYNQCAESISFVVTVTAKTTPVFNLNSSYCLGSAPQNLPAISNNGITGTWYPSAIDTSVAGAATYTFTPDAGQCADVYTLAVMVSVQTDPVFSLTTIYCKDSTPDTLPLTSDNGISGTWNPSVIDTSPIGTKIYTFTPDSGQCATSYTLSVTVNQNIALSTTIPDNIIFCEGDSVVVDAGNDYPSGYYTWTWGNGNTFTGSQLTITEEGDYTLVVSDGSGCSSKFVVTASYYDKPVIKSVSIDGSKITVIAEGENLEYSLDNIIWQTSNVFDKLQEGRLYTVYVRSNGCAAVSINVPLYKITNFFSPNGDGYNDIWKLYPDGVLEASHIIIADRYGKTVYEKFSNTGFVWDGKNGGKPLPTETYWYILEIPATQYLPPMKYTGFILLKNR